MAERVEAWWQRRQRTHGSDVPYAVGTYREQWASFPVLIRQYHPELNGGVVLTQIPPAADVLLQWQCEVGHIFVATPTEQRNRPGKQRRRSSWCPVCAGEAVGRTPRLREATDPPPTRALELGAEALSGLRRDASADRRPGGRLRATHAICPLTPDVPTGTPFVSRCAPPPSSAVEADLRMRLFERFDFERGLTAVRVARPFFTHYEVWPDLVLGELRIAVEYDSTGRHGLEHVGPRERVDKRKDAALRGAGWEIIRIRTGKLPELGPHDLVAGTVTNRLVERLIDELRAIRGPLFVDAYLR